MTPEEDELMSRMNGDMWASFERMKKAEIMLSASRDRCRALEGVVAKLKETLAICKGCLGETGHGLCGSCLNRIDDALSDSLPSAPPKVGGG